MNMNNVTNIIDNIPPFLNDAIPPLTIKSDAEILELIHKLRTTNSLLTSAWSAVVFECDRRGLDISGLLEVSELNYYRKVASGEVIPQLVARFETTEKRHRLLPLAKLNKEDQTRVASGQPIEVAELSDDGSVSHRLMTVDEMPLPTFNRVINNGKIVSVANQAHAIREKIQKKTTVKIYTHSWNRQAKRLDIKYGDQQVYCIPKRELIALAELAQG